VEIENMPPAAKIDRIDRQILALLQRDGRQTTQQISDQVGLSPTPVLRRIRMMEESGLIKGYVALVDRSGWSGSARRLCCVSPAPSRIGPRCWNAT
jgi:DNA-binding Lrp family transcriptional regulator